MRWTAEICFLGVLIVVGAAEAAGQSEGGTAFRSFWPSGVERVWAGPEYWANTLEDWRVAGGRLECVRSGGDRNVYLLTRDLAPEPGRFEMGVSLGQLDPSQTAFSHGWVGFRVGSRGEFEDYRDSAIRGEGLIAGLALDGRLFIGDREIGTQGLLSPPFENLRLLLRAEPLDNKYQVSLHVLDSKGMVIVEELREDIDPDWLRGDLALVASSQMRQSADLTKPRPAFDGDPNGYRRGELRGGNARFWFRDWTVSGDKVRAHEDRAWGPVLFTQYTLSRGVLKLKAQLAPVGNGSREASLEVDTTGDGRWQSLGQAVIDPLARTALFRVPDWDDTRDVMYRVVYDYTLADGRTEPRYFAGRVRRDPRDKPEIVVAAFTGNNDFGFPHADVVRRVSWHQPDLLVYTGDQIYERTGEYEVLQTTDVNLSTLDYLRKWYLFGWEYRDLLRDIPSLCLPDDHDVFQGNIWGAGGRNAGFTCGKPYAEAQDWGGYCMPPEWVNMIQRTQTAQMPDPYDPAPVEQGISVYYSELLWGGISFAVIEDRKWKSSPGELLSKWEVVNGWARNPDYNAARDGDVPGAELLGQRQLNFLDHWAADWSGGAWMKTVVSQTLFTNVASLPPPARADDVVPTLSLPLPGEYPAGDVEVADHDSDGWPQSGRNEAIRRMRKAFAFHISGDQHLGSTVQYGVDQWRDAGYAVCVPSVANVWPRRWFPSVPGRNRVPGSPKYTGDFLDGFGNRVTVLAVSNPHRVGIAPAWINDRAPGYGIVKFDRSGRSISIANWPRWVDPGAPGAKPYPGWPVVISQQDNYGRQAAAWLPELLVSGLTDPVVQVREDDTGEIVYTLRIEGTSFRPKVFQGGSYTLRVGDPDRDVWKVFRGVKATAGPEGKLEVDF